MGAARARCAVQRCRTCAIETRRFALRPRLTPSCATLMATPDCSCKFAQPIRVLEASEHPPPHRRHRRLSGCGVDVCILWRTAAVSHNYLPGVRGNGLYSIEMVSKARNIVSMTACRHPRARERERDSWGLSMKHVYPNLLHMHVWDHML